jgi:PAS domain S-box-containing protein
MNDEAAQSVEELLEASDLADALKDDRFKQLLDKMPIAILVATMKGRERIIYVNPAFERLTGQTKAGVEGMSWNALNGKGENDGRELSTAIMEGTDRIGSFKIARLGAEPALVDSYSNVIETDDGAPAFRLVALIDVSAYVHAEREQFEQSMRDKDILLLELQHRVKNNLQMITALIRLEARSSPEGTEALNRIAGRIEALNILYQFLSAHGQSQEVDLGAYISQVAAAVMRTHAVEGIRLNLKADVYPVSVNIAMPTGLVVNELMTNALKHAFVGREGGTITLECLSGDTCWKVVVADDGIGLPPGAEWPERGNLGALIVQSLRENANAELKVDSSPGQGTRVTLLFAPTVTA